MARTSKTKKVAKSDIINFTYAVMGQAPAKKTSKKGLTIGGLRQHYTLENLKVKVNGQEQYDDYTIKNGDFVVVLTNVKGGN